MVAAKRSVFNFMLNRSRGAEYEPNTLTISFLRNAIAFVVALTLIITASVMILVRLPFRHILKGALTIALVGAISMASVAVAAQTVSGKVTKVRDADTVVVSGVPIRLNGVDAPENGTRAGNEATAAMKRYLRGKTLTCELNGERTYDRWVGVCFTEEGQDIGAFMIENGYALDCRKFSG